MNERQNKVHITKGLKFTSTSFRMQAEISAIREDKNEVDVILTGTDDNAWEEKNWCFIYLKHRFQTGEFKPIELNQVNISVF